LTIPREHQRRRSDTGPDRCANKRNKYQANDILNTVDLLMEMDYLLQTIDRDQGLQGIPNRHAHREVERSTCQQGSQQYSQCDPGPVLVSQDEQSCQTDTGGRPDWRSIRLNKGHL
jgi:hypothetical protein